MDSTKDLLTDLELRHTELIQRIDQLDSMVIQVLEDWSKTNLAPDKESHIDSDN